MSITSDCFHLLGVSAAEPNFDCVRIAPDLALADTVSGSVTIPGGDVTVEWMNSTDRFRLIVSVPTGIHLQVRLPAAPTDELFIDDEPIAQDTQTVRTEQFVELAVLPGSRYGFDVIRK
jgi:hypothetical protein